jgi:hypothetical protein
MRSPIARLSAPSLIAAALLLAPAAHSQPTDPAKLEQAKKHMQAGAAFYNDPSGHKCEEAIREFGKAFDLSGSLNALKGMAICNLELERDGEAIEQYTKYLAGKGSSIAADEKHQLETDLNALKAAVATVKISVDKPGVKITDVRTPSRGYPISNTYPIPVSGKKLGIHPGQHVFTASVEGQPDLVWKVEIANGGTYEHSFEFDKGKPVTAEGFKDTPAPEETKTVRPIPIAAWVVGGITVASIGTWVGLMIRARNIHNSYTEANGQASRTELESLQSSVKSANLISDVFMGVSIAGVAATTIIILTRPSKKVPIKAGGLSVTPTFDLTGGGAIVRGTF